MTAPASGSLQLARLRNEFENGSYINTYTASATSLEDLSTGQYGTSYGGPDSAINLANMNANKPDGDAPHSMSEFYHYHLAQLLMVVKVVTVLLQYHTLLILSGMYTLNHHGLV